MPYRVTPFENQYVYHIYNRGVEKRTIFGGDGDYQRFLQTLYYYQFSGPKARFSTYRKFKDQSFEQHPKIVEVICYCLMPNHFHLMIKQLKDGGIQEFIRKTCNSYTKYFNTKHNRVGPLFQNNFKAVLVETDEQLLHLSRYIHLNPYVSELTNNLDSFYYSSYPDFIGITPGKLCIKESILQFFPGPNNYKEFVTDYQDYAQRIHQIQHLLIEE